MTNIAAISDEEFSERFGPEMLRFRSEVDNLSRGEQLIAELEHAVYTWVMNGEHWKIQKLEEFLKNP